MPQAVAAIKELTVPADVRAILAYEESHKYVARNPAGVRLWVFRDRQPAGRWFLHGVFG